MIKILSIYIIYMSYYTNKSCFDEFKHIENDLVDLVLVDLPYGATSCKWDRKINLEKMWDELKRICTDKCIYIFFTTTRFGYELIKSNIKWFKYDMSWVKSRKVGFLNANNAPLRQHEMIYIFYNKKGTYNPQKSKGGKKTKEGLIKILKPSTASYYRPEGKTYTKTTYINTTGELHPTSVIYYDNPHKSVHRTQKPVDMLEYLIKQYSNEGDTVIDFCMGSGSTILACIKTNRRYIGVEMNKDIYDIADKRIKEALSEMKEESEKEEESDGSE